MLDYKPNMTKRQMKEFEAELIKEYTYHNEETSEELVNRIGGISGTAGSSSFQFVGYKKLQEMYRGDQWDSNQPHGS